ncbi:glycoside hydrolase family 3 protein [Sphaerisporangium sp. TRM90804]|uniref:glycoside hydrolase family 3 protein n=1 Tax=Sphaerisporangium sp. TRM90804 TaxID=3031113 RepID=UPI00244B5D28|nr:glycoside hydrolase family 3 protein [Sphaerisporangium sp. TRM90804]MDH2427872.1 glycoside hydrolase family 3 N-terminal domain-containing protein [Sphaerisporangium sp. TRM90804]
MGGRVRAAALLVIATVTAGCAGTPPEPPPAAPTRAAPPASSPPATPAASPSPSASAPAPAEALLAGMSLAEKVGQLFMPVLYGARADAAHGENQARFGAGAPAQVVRKYRPGGVILFPWAGNVADAGQLVKLADGLQEASEIPLMIGADQENGVVSRLSPLVTDVPGSMAIGATGDPEQARAAARVTGAELRALGLNLDFAPVADVNVDPANPVIGARSYGSDPKRVAAMVGAAVDGFHEAGVASAAKHFPGHGDTRVDSHSGLPVIDHSRSQWDRLDAPPFRAAVERGVDIVMSAHVVMPKLDPSGDPATLSKPIITGLLRDELGYDGVVSTDALDMDAVREKYGDGEVAVRAILAGVDLLLMPPDLPKAHAAVLAAVESGRISRDRLDRSVSRLLALKAGRGILDGPAPGAGQAAKVLRSEEHRARAQRIADRSVTAVKGAGRLPLKGDVLVTGPAARRLARMLDGATAAGTGDTPTAAQTASARAAAARADVVVVTTRDAGPAQARLVAEMARTGKTLVVVSMGAPYELSRLRGYDAALAVYSDGDASLRAAAKALSGTLKPAGALPVELNGG